MLKHVLVPLDGSKLAEQALEYAKGILVPKGKISLVCAVEIPEAVGYGYLTPASDDDYQKYLPLAQRYLKRITLEHANDEIFFDFSAVIGDASTVIIEHAEKLRVNAIVMTTHGRSGLSRFFLGSITTKVLNSKVCPVFVIFGKETGAESVVTELEQSQRK